VEIEVTQPGVEVEQRRLARRGILAAGIGGAALSLLPFLSGRASASATTDSTPESTTTTAPPRRPSDDDVTLLAFAQQMELTVFGLYDAAISGVAGWSPAQLALLNELRQAHLAFANSLSGLLGRSAPDTRSQELFDLWKSKFTGSTDDVLQSASNLESAVVATYLDMLAKLQGLNGASLVASIVVAEARHSTALSNLAGVSDLAVLLVDSEADSLMGNG
jgi:hypothetical protein